MSCGGRQTPLCRWPTNPCSGLVPDRRHVADADLNLPMSRSAHGAGGPQNRPGSRAEPSTESAGVAGRGRQREGSNDAVAGIVTNGLRCSMKRSLSRTAPRLSGCRTHRQCHRRALRVISAKTETKAGPGCSRSRGFPSARPKRRWKDSARPESEQIGMSVASVHAIAINLNAIRTAPD